MKKNTVRKFAWSIYLMGAAVLILVNAYHPILGHNAAGFFSLFSTLILVPVIIESVIHLSFIGVFFPAAIISIIFSHNDKITAAVPWLADITPWPVLGAALLLTIGFSIIFGKRDKWCGNFDSDEKENFENITDDDTKCTVKFGESTKFIISENLEKVYLDCSFGAIKAYFENAKLSPNGAHLYINAHFSGIELYIPKHWKVVKGVSCVMGGIEEKAKNVSDADSPILNITGNIRLSGVVIHYI